MHLLDIGQHSQGLCPPPPYDTPWTHQTLHHSHTHHHQHPPLQKILPRNFKTTQQYAEAARQVAAASPSGKVALLDLWQAFINSGSDWGTRLMWGDGLHLSKAGNDMVYDQLWNVLNSKQLT